MTIKTRACFKKSLTFWHETRVPAKKRINEKGFTATQKRLAIFSPNGQLGDFTRQNQLLRVVQKKNYHHVHSSAWNKRYHAHTWKIGGTDGWKSFVQRVVSNTKEPREPPYDYNTKYFMSVSVRMFLIFISSWYAHTSLSGVTMWE